MTDSERPEDPENRLSDEPTEGAGWTATGDDDLPDIEELTPEIVEEEAIRGDFMLRWAMIFLAVLLGCGQISDTRTLVHIRSGDQMRANGFLPPRTDVLSFANEGHSTANVSWLFDHVVSIAWAIGSGMGLTVFKAIIAGIIAWLISRISVPGLPTWWSSICGAVAMAACYSDFIPITDLATLVGIALLLGMLHRIQQGDSSGMIWKVPLLIAVWANFDHHAWIGSFAVILFTVGSTIVSRTETRLERTHPNLWPVAALSVLALLINPFPAASVLSAITTYAVEYPALRELNPITGRLAGLLDGRTEYYSLLNENVWDGFEFAYVAALTVIVFAAVTLFLSRERRDVPWAVLLTGFGILAFLTLHELAPAAVVAAVAASLAGQRWYRRTFPQEYSIKSSEVLFSRGGRAATVFSLALLGFLVVADRLPTRSAVGKGFTPDLQTTIDSTAPQLAELPEDARILHTRADHGDLLIWNGRQSFVDTRVTPFGSPDDEASVASQYRNLRHDLVLASAEFQLAVVKQQSQLQDAARKAVDMANAQGSGTAPELPAVAPIMPSELDVSVRERLDRTGITHVLVRLSPPGPPDYDTIRRLVGNRRDWTITALGPSSAVFARSNFEIASAGADVKELDTRQLAFEKVRPMDVTRYEFAREPGFYDRHLYRTRPSQSADLRLARHFLSLQPTPSNLMIALRAASRVVARDPQSADGYHTLGLAYSQLDDWETATAGQLGGQSPSSLRYLQTVTALRQALTIRPDLANGWGILFQQYMKRGRIDLALECLDQAMPQLEREAAASDNPDAEAIFQQQVETHEQLSQRAAEIESQLDTALGGDFSEIPAEHGAQKLQLAQQTATVGHVSAALRVLNDSMEVIEKEPRLYLAAETLRAQLLMESGAAEEALELYTRLNLLAEENKMPAGTGPWTTMSAIAQIVRGDYATASTELNVAVSSLQENDANPLVIQGTLATLPLIGAIETSVRAPLPARWPYAHLGVTRATMTTSRAAQAEPRFILAVAYLEWGDVLKARNALEALITECGATAWRPLATVYLNQLNEDVSEFVTKHSLVTWEPEPADEDFSPSSEPTDEKPEEKQPADEVSADESTADDKPVEADSREDEPSEDADDDATDDGEPTDSAANDDASKKNN